MFPRMFFLLPTLETVAVGRKTDPMQKAKMIPNKFRNMHYFQYINAVIFFAFGKQLMFFNIKSQGVVCGQYIIFSKVVTFNA